MSPEKQRIVIGRVCGKISPDCDAALKYFKDRDGYPNAILELARVPDYPNDLDAMHQAEDSGGDPLRYLIELSTVCNGCRLNLKDDPSCLANYILNCIHATAAERAEAFLRTIGKWENP